MRVFAEGLVPEDFFNHFLKKLKCIEAQTACDVARVALAERKFFLLLLLSFFFPIIFYLIIFLLQMQTHQGNKK